MLTNVNQIFTDRRFIIHDPLFNKKKTKVNQVFTNRRFIIHNMFFNIKVDKGEPDIYKSKVYI